MGAEAPTSNVGSDNCLATVLTIQVAIFIVDGQVNDIPAIGSRCGADLIPLSLATPVTETRSIRCHSVTRISARPGERFPRQGVSKAQGFGLSGHRI